MANKIISTFAAAAPFYDQEKADRQIRYYQWQSNYPTRDEVTRERRHSETDGMTVRFMDEKGERYDGYSVEVPRNRSLNHLHSQDRGLSLGQSPELHQLFRFVPVRLPIRPISGGRIESQRPVTRVIPTDLARVAREVEADWLRSLQQPQNRNRAIRWFVEKLQRYEHMSPEVRLPRSHYGMNPEGSQTYDELNSEAEQAIVKIDRWLGFECQELAKRYFADLSVDRGYALVEIHNALNHLTALRMEIQAIYNNAADQLCGLLGGPGLPIVRELTTMPSQSFLRVSHCMAEIELYLRLYESPETVERFRAEPLVDCVRSLGLLVLMRAKDAAIQFMIAPSVKIHTENNHIHRADGPAVEWGEPAPERQGFISEEYFLEGYLMQPSWVVSPESISLDQINATWNTEIRRIMIGLYGWDRYLENMRSTPVDMAVVSAGGSNWIETLFDASSADNMRVLMTYDPSTGGRFSLVVPPECSTCHQAQEFLSGGDDVFSGLGPEMMEEAHSRPNGNPYPRIRT
jgi:hypothetical protein